MENFALHSVQRSMTVIGAPQTQAQIGVSFKQLDCYGYTAISQGQMSMLDYLVSIVKRARYTIWPWSRERMQILQGFEGLILPGEMLLVLGRTGSGCSTLLKTLSGDTAGLTIAQESNLNYQGMFLHQLAQ